MRMYCLSSRCRKICYQIFMQSRETASAPRIAVSLNEKVSADVLDNIYKPRKHPGIRKSPPAVLPSDIQEAIQQTVIAYGAPIKKLLNEGQELNNYIYSRHPPNEDEIIEEKKQMLQNQVEERISFDKSLANEEEQKHYEKVVSSRVNRLMLKYIYHWKPITYDRHTSLKYALTRGPAEYAALCRVFAEIKKTSPRSLFDFGSGVGSVRWAAESTWGDSIKEYYCVDASSDMNDIAANILEKSGRKSSISYFRQFLPASNEKIFDIVVSSYSLFELPSSSSRLQTVANLWNKTNKYLVLIETGTLAAHRLIIEARDFILQTFKDSKSLVGHVTAPCPHDEACPRKDGTPCNFIVTYQDMKSKQPLSKELFTYLILTKGERDENKEEWPRIVRPVLQRSRHVVCKLCTHRGKLEQVTISKTKPDRATYRCAKACTWGDLLPVKIYDKESLPEDDGNESE